MNVVYFIWAKNTERAKKISQLTAISTTSAKEKKFNIYVYLSDKDKFSTLIEYLNSLGCTTRVVTRSRDAKFINKVLFFRHAIDELNSFLYVDCDTFVVNKPPSYIIKKNLCFGRYKSRRLMRNPVKYDKNISLVFDTTKKIKYISSRFFWVNQKNKVFWNRYRDEIDILIKKYMERIDILSGKIDVGGLADEQIFTLAMLNMNINPKKYNIKNFNTTSYFLLHGTRECKKNKNYLRTVKVLKHQLKSLF